MGDDEVHGPSIRAKFNNARPLDGGGIVHHLDEI